MSVKREIAFQEYINEITENGNKRLDNILICASVPERTKRHIATQVDLAFQAGWLARTADTNEGQ